MAWFRNVFCPEGTANTRCAVPETETDGSWCLEFYGQTDCLQIRADAQSLMERMMLPFYYLNASWGIFTIILVSADATLNLETVSCSYFTLSQLRLFSSVHASSCYSLSKHLKALYQNHWCKSLKSPMFLLGWHSL
jgi:hypothetical protein